MITYQIVRVVVINASKCMINGPTMRTWFTVTATMAAKSRQFLLGESMVQNQKRRSSWLVTEQNTVSNNLKRNTSKFTSHLVNLKESLQED